MMIRPLSRTFAAVVAGLALVVAAPSRATAASMCNTDAAASSALGAATARGSAKFLEAASQAFLAFKAIEEKADAFPGHLEQVRRLLDGAIEDYQEALKLSQDLAQADAFLRERPFERLRSTLGLSPGSLNYNRWSIIAKTARESKTPAAALITVCVTSAQQLKADAGSITPSMHPAQVRRAAYTWQLVLMHGSLVSDAFDASVR
jgi:hypothetical protein